MQQTLEEPRLHADRFTVEELEPIGVTGLKLADPALRLRADAEFYGAVWRRPDDIEMLHMLFRQRKNESDRHRVAEHVGIALAAKSHQHATVEKLVVALVQLGLGDAVVHPF